MVFNTNGVLIEVDDGGIAALLNRRKAGVSPNWVSLNPPDSVRTLQLTQFNSVAYDTTAGLITGGAQDVGISQQLSGTKEEWTQGLPRTKEDRRSGGDGGVVQLIQGTPSQYYLSANSLGASAFPINYSGSPPAVIVGDPTSCRAHRGRRGGRRCSGSRVQPDCHSYIIRRQSIQPSRILVPRAGALRERRRRDDVPNVDPSAGAGTFTAGIRGFVPPPATRGGIIAAAQGNTIWFRPPGWPRPVSSGTQSRLRSSTRVEPVGFSLRLRGGARFQQDHPDKVYHSSESDDACHVVRRRHHQQSERRDLRTVGDGARHERVGDIVLAGGLLGVSV
jgi:hypothetical protein